MKNLILISEGEYYQFDNIEELKKFIIPNMENLEKEKIEKCLYEAIFGFSMLNNLQIVETSKGVYEGNYEIGNEKIDLKRAIIIDNLDTYILSLCKFGAIHLLEEKDNRFYTKNINVELNENNYVVVNAYANELLKRMVGEKYE